MAKFHGPINLHLGVPVWAGSTFDHESQDYVVEVSGDDVKKFRDLAEQYGFVEDESSEAESKPARKAAPAKAAKAN